MKKNTTYKDAVGRMVTRFKRNWMDGDYVRFSGIIYDNKRIKGFDKYEDESYFYGNMDIKTGEMYSGGLSKEGERIVREEWLKIKEYFVKDKEVVQK